tara:strand:- start:1566 stop:2006 length:441 start_codon:yes stop_codon:yes gene_type:complete
MRTQLYGTGERGIQNYGFIDLPDGKTRVINHIPAGISSTGVTLRPSAYLGGQQTSDANFKFTILDHRGLTATIGGQTIVGEAFNSSKVDKRSANGRELFINAVDGQISKETTRTILVELVDGGAAAATVTLTVQRNTDSKEAKGFK